MDSPPSTSTIIELTDSEKTFRDHIPTTDSKGKRVWVYPRKPKGKFYNARTWVSYVLLIIMGVGPWIRIHGNPLLMFNIIERKFSIFGLMFWPQDLHLFALAMLCGFLSIILFTAVFGRIWCGWLCPQTVMMEMVFRKIEYLIEGDAPRQRTLDRAAWGFSKTFKKVLKWTIFYALSFAVGNILLMYVIGSTAWLRLVSDPPHQHLLGLTFMFLFSLLFFGIFTRFREQACTFICPYGRFQSALLDENTIVVAYDHKRGDPQGKIQRGQDHAARQDAGLGDCVNCRACYQVCPTGIDIRNGTQMECVNCTACIDACDGVMSKLKMPAGLIRFASMNNIERGEKLRFTPRLGIYTVILVVLFSLLTFLLTTRDPVEVNLLRAKGMLFNRMPNGDISNVYTVKFVNKTNEPMPLELRLLEPEGTVILVGGAMVVPPGELSETSVIISIAPEHLKGETQNIRIAAFSGDKLMHKLHSNFMGPYLGGGE